MPAFNDIYHTMATPVALISLIATILLITFQFKTNYNSGLRTATLWLVGVGAVGNIFIAGIKMGSFTGSCEKVRDNYKVLSYYKTTNRKIKKTASGGGMIGLWLFIGIFFLFAFPYLSASQCSYDNNKPKNTASVGMKVFTFIAMGVSILILVIEFYRVYNNRRS